MEVFAARHVAAKLGVTPDSVSRWVRNGKLKPCMHTPGGHARFDEVAINKLRHKPAVTYSERNALRALSELIEPPAPKEPPPPPAPKPSIWDGRVWKPKPARIRNYGRPPARDISPPKPTIADFKRRREQRARGELDAGGPPRYLPNERAWNDEVRWEEYAVRRTATAPIYFAKRFGMSRRELFHLLWRVPTRRVAETFGLTDNGLRKICKIYLIPIPPRGYWASLRSTRPTKTYERPELPELVVVRKKRGARG